MIKKLVVVSMVAFFCTTSLIAKPYAGGDSTNNNSSNVVKFSRDFITLQLGYNTWLNKPDSIKTKGLGYVFNLYACYDFPIKKSNFSFATGLGIHTSTIFLKDMELARTDTGIVGGQARFIAERKDYKRYKFNEVYLQAPFELRYFSNKRNRNKGIKAALGIQVGTLLGSHIKAVTSVEGSTVKEKISTKRYLSTWDFNSTFRVGYGNFSVYGSYNLTKVFKDLYGPDLVPFSAGICITGL